MGKFVAQIGISPKVLGPFLTAVIGAIVLYLVGEPTMAKGIALAAVAQLGVGYTLPPGAMHVTPDASGDFGHLNGTNPPTGAPMPADTPRGVNPE